MKDSIKTKVAIAGIFTLLMTVLTIFQTYALFETEGNAVRTLDIGDWSIILNDVNVSQSRSITLNDFHYTNGSHTRVDRFAPGSSAYFDLVIDASDSQVSVEYILEIDDSVIEDYPNIYFSITDMSNNQVLDTNTYYGTILLGSQNRTSTLRITLIWANDPDYDESDTSLIGESLSFTIDANFRQYLGE